MIKEKNNIAKVECFYGIDVISLVLSLYGKDSEIYKAMAKGEMISGMVRTDIKTKGTKAAYRIADKKKLYKMAKDKESEKENNVNV